ncbi:hypothetical protein [Actinomadura sp. WMMB 499]|uniref:hypothetical protein n=1 Tax=Actinomadura sp. WMMB 499 TaxID=1219491 RepID=UPI00124464B0|nr:hypothetical protein [Actinomadura sp. WMMB 499]QFG25430.1 hypothetical protein F7P10_34000 [Actinomadura sp. WMMB 499]
MIEMKCEHCGAELEWKGRGRKPKRCKPCGRESNRKKTAKTITRGRLHKKGEATTRFGELWLLKDVFGNPYAVRREARYVWGATGPNDEQVNGRSGVFHKIGSEGLPNEGHSVPTTNEYADLRWIISENHRLAQESAEADEWLNGIPCNCKAARLYENVFLAKHEKGCTYKPGHTYWWKFEAHAHGLFTRDVTESAVVHAESLEDDPDETSVKDRCTWCGDRRPLVLAHEFCGDACMTDYVTTFGPDGLDLEGGFDAHDTGGVAEAWRRADAPVVLRAAA